QSHLMSGSQEGTAFHPERRRAQLANKAPVRHSERSLRSEESLFSWAFTDLPKWAALLLLGMASLPNSALAQDEITPQTPYATLDRNGVAYRGPGRENAANLQGATVKIGLLLSLQGASAADGQSLLAAANMALAEEEAAGPLADGRHLALAVRNQA